MKEEQVEKIFNLIEPFLPKQTANGFRKFMEYFKELKQLNDYNLLVIERQRNTIDQLSQKVRMNNERDKKHAAETTKLMEEVEKWNSALYEERKKQQKLTEEIVSLQNKMIELETLLQNETDKNYNFAESVAKMADDNRYMLAMNRKFVSENIELKELLKNQTNALIAEKELLEKQYTELLTEYENVQERIQMEYGRGFQTAHFHHIRRKR